MELPGSCSYFSWESCEPCCRTFDHAQARMEILPELLMCKRLTGAGVKLLGSSILFAGTGDGFWSSQGAARFRAKAVRHAARKMYGACMHGGSAY